MPCLRALQRARTRVSFEVIVADDASTDLTGSIEQRIYGISVVRGRPKEYIDETEEMIADGINADAHVGHTDALSLSETRVDEAEKSDMEATFTAGQSRNIGKVGIKVLSMKPGMAEIMILSPTVKKTRLIHGKAFEVGKYDISLVGVHGDKAIIRVEED